MTRFLARPVRDLWPQVFFVLHAAHNVWFAGRYPHGVYDPDLLTYFVHFRNWTTHTPPLRDADWLATTNPLLIFGLGPLADASLAFMMTAVASAFVGSLVYLIGRDTFGRAQGALMSAILLLDVDRASLTLRSSADLYLALFLLAAIHASLQHRYVRSGFAIGLATLIKPVALPCALHLLAVGGARRHWARAAALIPFVFMPIVFASNYALLGSLTGLEVLANVDGPMQSVPLAPTDVVRFVFWNQLVQAAFVTTAPLGFLGLLAFLTADPRRVTSPFVLVPALLLLGYAGMCLLVPYVPYFRFFWLIQVWFVGFIVHGIAEIGIRLGGARRWARVAMMTVLLAFLVNDHLVRQIRYRQTFTDPFQDAMAFVSSTSPTLVHERLSGETILTPRSFVPYLLWNLDDARRHPSVLVTAERWAAARTGEKPDWVLYVPTGYVTPDTRQLVDQLLATGEYATRIVEGSFALFERTRPAETYARRSTAPHR